MIFKTGDSVRVKTGVQCPDLKTLDISGWQGRLFEMEEGDDVVGIRWDSITLEKMTLDYIQKSEKEGLGWTEMYLSVGELEPARPRDSEKKAKKVAEEMESKFGWAWERKANAFSWSSGMRNRARNWRHGTLICGERWSFPLKPKWRNPKTTIPWIAATRYK